MAHELAVLRHAPNARSASTTLTHCSCTAHRSKRDGVTIEAPCHLTLDRDGHVGAGSGGSAAGVMARSCLATSRASTHTHARPVLRDVCVHTVLAPGERCCWPPDMRDVSVESADIDGQRGG